jgi:hypothetical protein
MTPREQINALMGAVQDQPPDQVAPCKKNKTHWFKLFVRWEDDETPVPTADFEAYRGKSVYTSDIVGNGKYGDSKVPPGNYQVFFPNIDQSEIIEG